METIYTNATIITRDETVHGTLVVEGEVIKDVDSSIFRGCGAVDLEGEMLLPGLIEIHTDNLEKNIQPRPGVIWPSIMSAAMAHDAQVAGAGITTVFDALAVGGLRQSSLRSRIFKDSIEALSKGKEHGVFKADHFLHLRCEVADESMEEMLLPQSANPAIRLISIMDHTPGQRQWSNLEKWRLYHRDKGWTEKEALSMIRELQAMQKMCAGKHRRLAVALAHEKYIPLASHDDTTVEDVATAVAEGIAIAEFPTTLAAAEKAKEYQMATIIGAPNAVRGGSHSGNISALELVENDLLDGLSSDYVPSSLLHAAFYLAEQRQKPLPQTVGLVSCNIADIVGLADRGELAAGKRADMLQVRMFDGLPVLKKVWRQGRQIG
ncbi:MAG: hypothetical protein AVO39_07585 [delta proteobacterium MLS_D]|jgi:alpha-D-ribose 1-methylphosphonate 5-triphosphate diphosphatase|nr:MAG: hypothetical protein AVO39_07585 [delta proteobacterium MLS_D]